MSKKKDIREDGVRTERNDRSTEVKESRKRRVGLGMYQKSMTLPDGLIPPGYKPRWINDAGDRLQRALDGGYVFVENIKDLHVGDGVESSNTDMGSRFSKVVDRTPRMNGAMRAFLMMIKEEYYREDQEEKLKKVEVVDRTIKRGKYKAKEQSGDGEDSFYGEMKYQA